MKNLSLKTSCLALICTFLWGAGYSVVKYSYSEFGILPEDIPSKLLFAGIRFMLAGGLTLGYLWMRRKKPPCPTGISTGALFCLSMFQTVLQYAFTYLGLALTTGSKSAILNQINIFLLVLLTPLFFRKESLTVPKCIGCILGFAGIIVINLEGLRFSFQSGDGFIVLSSLSAAAGYLISKKYAGNADPAVVTGMQQFLGGTVLLTSGLLTGGYITRFTLSGILSLVFLSLAAAVSYTLWVRLLQTNDVSAISVYKFLTPLFGVLLSGLLLGEPVLCWQNGISLALICLGIYLANKTTFIYDCKNWRKIWNASKSLK